MDYEDERIDMIYKLCLKIVIIILIIIFTVIYLIFNQ